MTAQEKEHWSLYLVDTYILYNIVYLIILVGLSVMRRTEFGYLWYKLGIKNPMSDYNAWREHKQFWQDEKTKQEQLVQGEGGKQSGGGSNQYSLKIWAIVLLWSLLLFILAILFPSRTSEKFTNVTMPSMFKDSILDTEKSDSDKLGFLFRHIWSPNRNAEKYTVQPHDVEDIEFIRKTDAEFRKSNSSTDGEKFKFSEGFTNLKTVCGSTNDSTKLLDKQNLYRCKDNLILKGENCHNKSKSPCCQRYCPSDSGYGTYHYGDDQGGHVTTLDRPPNNNIAPNWQCNTESRWDNIKNQCMHVTGNIKTDLVYHPVMENGAGTNDINEEIIPQESSGANLTGDVQL